MLFLIPLVERVIGRVCPLVTLRLIRPLRNTWYQSPRNKLKQEFPLAKLCHFSLTSLLSCAPTYVTECSFHPYPRWKRTSSRDLAFFCLDFYSGDRASDLGRVYTKEVLLLPEDQGLLFHHTFGKTLRGKDSKNQFAVKRCPQDTVVCPVVNLTTYVKIADLMNINLREGFLFRATDPKGRVSPKPFVGSTVANRLRLYLTALNIDEGETMHSFRSGCSITLSLLGASDDQVASHVGWKSIQVARYYSQVPKVMDLSLPASLLAQGTVRGKDSISRAGSLGAEFRARNNLEGLSLAFP